VSCKRTMLGVLPAVAAIALTMGTVTTEAASAIDGYYTGVALVTNNKIGSCNATVNVTLRVTDGQASIRYNPTTTLTGPMQPDGSLSMSGNGTNFAGRIAGNQFLGQSDNERCSYKFSLTRP